MAGRQPQQSGMRGMSPQRGPPQGGGRGPPPGRGPPAGRGRPVSPPRGGGGGGRGPPARSPGRGPPQRGQSPGRGPPQGGRGPPQRGQSPGRGPPQGRGPPGRGTSPQRGSMPQRGPSGPVSPGRGPPQGAGRGPPQRGQSPGRGPPQRGQSPGRGPPAGGAGGGGDWGSKVDPQSGREYYFNRRTKETTWSRPPVYGGGGGPPAQGQLGTGYDREMGGGGRGYDAGGAKAGGIDLEDVSANLKGPWTPLRIGVIGGMLLLVLAVAAFLVLSEDEVPVTPAAQGGTSAGAGAVGGTVEGVDCSSGDRPLPTCAHCQLELAEPDNTAAGAIANIRCDAGYTNAAEGSIQCTSDGVWDNLAPACADAVDCGAVTIANGRAAGDTWYEPDTPMRAECDVGYALQPNQPTLTCNSDGSWSPNPLPQCARTHCDASALNIEGGSVQGCPGDRCDVGTVTIACTDASHNQDGASPECVADGNNEPHWEQDGVRQAAPAVTCAAADPCAGMDCGAPNGSCAGGSCTCNEGWTTSASACDSCAPGYEDQSGSCVDIDECSGGRGPCDDFGDAEATCNNVAPPNGGMGEHTCECTSGYDVDQRVASAGGPTCRATVTQAVVDREATVVVLRDRIRTAYASRCSTIGTTCDGSSTLDHCTDDACNPSAAWNTGGDGNTQQCLHSDLFGTDSYCSCAGAGRKMDAEHSTLTINKRVDRSAAAVTEAVCTSKGLDQQFRTNAQADSGLQFQWFASEAGPLRTYPGDARQLPSYSGATPDSRAFDAATASHRMTIYDEDGNPITDPLTCADCTAQGFSESQCSKYGLTCTNNNDRLTANAGYCNWDDPREQSWYVSAVSGPKDVVIVLDMSGSMARCAAGSTGDISNCATRIEVAKVAVKKVIETLNEVDYAQVVIFGGSASCYPSTLYNAETYCNGASDKALQMTEANKALLEQYVDDLTVIDGAATGFLKGFDKAFDILDRSVSDATAGCTKVILFFTDGAGTRLPNAAAASADYTALKTAVNARNNVDVATGAGAPHQAHVFWYSVARPSTEFTDDDKNHLQCNRCSSGVGPCGTCTSWHDLIGNTFKTSLGSSDIYPPYAKSITCRNRGVFVHIRDPYAVEDALASYYEFLSKGAASDTVRWGEPYTDATTGKEVIAGSLAAFTDATDPAGEGILLGVVGITVLMSDFTADDSARRTQLLNLVGDGAHSSRCVERATDIDSLEMLRYTHGTRVDPTRNNANDQAYISEQHERAVWHLVDDNLNGNTAYPTYFSTCCMDADRTDDDTGTAMAYYDEISDVCSGGSIRTPTQVQAGLKTTTSNVCPGVTVGEAAAICPADAGNECQEKFSCCGGPSTCPSGGACTSPSLGEMTWNDAIDALASSGR